MEREQLQNQIKEKYSIRDFVARGGYGAMALSTIETYIQQYHALFNGATADVKDKLIKNGFSTDLAAKVLSTELPEKYQERFNANQSLIEKYRKDFASAKDEQVKEQLKQSIADLEASNNELKVSSLLESEGGLQAILNAGDAVIKSSTEDLEKKTKLIELRNEALTKFFICQGIDPIEAKRYAEFEVTELEFLEIFNSIVEDINNGFKPDLVDFFTSMRSIKS